MAEMAAAVPLLQGKLLLYYYSDDYFKKPNIQLYVSSCYNQDLR